MLCLLTSPQLCGLRASCKRVPSLFGNRREVQDALHANCSGQLRWAYAGCTPLDESEKHYIDYSK